MLILKRRKLLTGLGVVVLSIAIAWLDWQIHEDVPLLILFTIPIAITAWKLGLRCGVAIAIACVIWWTNCDVVFKPDTPLWAIVASALLRLSVEIGIILLICGMQRSINKQKKLATTDDLTGLLNRRAYTESLNQELARLHRHPQSLVAAFLDVDNLSIANNWYSHHSGDLLLIALADALRSAFRRRLDRASIGRLSGDEFAAFFTGQSLGAIRFRMDLVEADLQSRIQAIGLPNMIGVSIGLVEFSPDALPSNADEVIRGSDTAMYAVKRSRKTGGHV